jgi:ADP-ribose pyrophosphatase
VTLILSKPPVGSRGRTGKGGSAMGEIVAEQTLDSDTVFEGKLVTVKRLKVRLPDGGSTEREIVEHPEVVAVIPRLDDGRIVMVRQYRKAAERVLLEVPAGGIDAGETAAEAVRREMLEETGYKVGSIRHLTSFYTSPGFTTELMHLYEATDLEAGEATEETDRIEVVLLTPDEATAQLAGTVPDAKTLLALAYAQGPGSSGSDRQSRLEI